MSNQNNFYNTTLGELVSKEKKSIISGPFGSNIGKRFFQKSGVPVIRGNNLSKGENKFNDSGFVFLTEEKANELNCFATIDDVIFTAVGTIGQVGIIEKDLNFDQYVISNKQFRVRFDKSKILPLYAYYWYSSKWIQKLIEQRNVGSTVPLINLGVAKGLPIKLPVSLNKQLQTVKILNDIYAKIELNNKINAELEGMAKLIYDYWFVQFNYPDKNGKPYKSSGGKMVFNEELKRAIPEGWEVGTFKDYSKSKGGFAFKSTWWSEKGIPVIKIKDINEDYTLNISALSFVSEDKFENAKSYQAFPGDVVIAMTGATVGKYGVVPELDKPLLVNQRVGTFDLGPSPIEKLPYLINSLNQKYFRENVFMLATGAAQPNISNTQIDNIPLIKPAKEYITKYNKDFQPLYERILGNQKQNQQLSSLRDWLLPMLMNGQVTVKGAYDKLEEVELGVAAEGEGEYK